MTNKYAPIIEKLQGHYPHPSQAHPPLDEAHLNKIESQLGYPLPSDYREFLRDYAGIHFESAVFRYHGEGYLGEGNIDFFDDSTAEKTLVDNYHHIRRIFISATRGPGHEVYSGIHLVRDVPSPVEELHWPEELLHIAYDAAGNDICLALFGMRPGAIFCWVHGDNIYLVADSFDEFMHLLQPL